MGIIESNMVRSAECAAEYKKKIRFTMVAMVQPPDPPHKEIT